MAMKKFSKILSRRLGRSGGDDHHRWDAGLQSGLDFHQLTSRRWRSGDDGLAMNGENHSRVFTKEVPTYGAGRILADGSEDAGQLCEICEAIDFPRLLDWKPGDARPWVSLAHCQRLKLPDEEELSRHRDGTTSEEEEDLSEDERRRRRRREGNLCPWCVFFHSMIVTVPEGDENGGADGRDDRAMKTKFTPYLRIRLAFERLGGGEKHPLAKSVLFEVTTRNRSLPWGYIVKAAPAQEANVPIDDGAETETRANPETASERGVDSGVESVTDVEVKEEVESEAKPRAIVVAEAKVEEPIKENQTGLATVNGKAKSGEEPKVIWGREITPLLHLDLAKNWIDFCGENHTTGPCAVKDRALVKGLRLIDCEENKVVLAETLSTPTPHDKPQDAAECQSITPSHKTSSIMHQNVEYVTLSYVMGTYREDDDDNSDNEHLPRRLPKVVTDAISTTKALGYRYLWVDRYCIPTRGDTKRASERRRQLDLMGQIYGHSALTLVVAAGEGVRDGIAGISAPREEQLSIQTESDLFTTSLLRPDLEVASSKWASRAWTYQEGLLSRRRLIFTPSQIYFQCQTLHCHESLSLPLQYAPGLNFGRVFPSSIDDALQPNKIKNHIKAYLAKSIGNTDDRLDAIRGLLHEYSAREKLPVENFLGLPLFHPDDFTKHKVVSQTDRLAIALGWMPSRPLPSSSVSSSSATSSHDDLIYSPAIDPYSLIDTPNPFPSWSWLAWHLSQTTSSSTYNYNIPSHTFNFNLVDDASPLLDRVSAPPGMEISVGFSDGMVLSWEIDGDAIARKADKIEMLRLKTFCFDLTVKKTAAGLGAKYGFSLAEPVASSLGKSATDSIEAWIRRSSVTVLSASADDVPAGLEYSLIGVLMSGRHWKPESTVQQQQPHGHHHRSAAAPTTAGPASTAMATILICRRANWDPDSRLIRLGVLNVAYDGLVSVAGEADASIMKGIDTRVGGEKKDLKVKLRELDIY
ncbi:heterokaryon incompatibility domain-containing protein [Trichoderma austrokoningii]